MSVFPLFAVLRNLPGSRLRSGLRVIGDVDDLRLLRPGFRPVFSGISAVQAPSVPQPFLDHGVAALLSDPVSLVGQRVQQIGRSVITLLFFAVLAIRRLRYSMRMSSTGLAATRSTLAYSVPRYVRCISPRS